MRLPLPRPLRTPAGWRTGPGVGALVLGCGMVLSPASLRAQDGSLATLRGGEIRVGIEGVFRAADERFGERTVDGIQVQEREPLAFDLRFTNASDLIPGTGELTAALRLLMADGAYAPLLGPTEAYAQASQVQVPFSLEVGLTDWLTLGVTLPIMRSRTEGEVEILPTLDADLGASPVVSQRGAVEAFVNEVSAAAAALGGAAGPGWTAWADAWAEAYASSAVFPVAGTAAGDALLARLAEFNGVLSANGIPQVSGLPPLASVALNGEELRSLLSTPGGPFNYLSLPNVTLWGLGDVKVRARLRLLEGGPLDETGRPSWGLVALGSLRIPTGGEDEVLALLDIPADFRVLGIEGGVGTWLRTSRLGLSAEARYEVGQPATLTRRVAPPEVVLAPRGSIARVERTPGDRVAVQVRPTFAVADPLWIEGFYGLYTAAGDEFTFVDPGDTPETLGARLAAPGPRYPAAVLSRETSSRLHLVGGGLRYQAPEGGFPVEAWAQAHFAVAGSGGQTLKEMRLSFGARLTQRLWGGR